MFVVTLAWLAPALGAATLLSVAIAGQMSFALVLDHYGLVGFPQRSMSPGRALGAGLLVVGVVIDAANDCCDRADRGCVMTLSRCPWCGSDPLYVAYHDEEWGVPSHDDRHLFEMLILEGAQAGLSWITILRKREAYRAAFAGFDPVKVARFTPARVERLLLEPRHRPQPAEDRRHCAQRAGVCRDAEGVRVVRPLHLAVRRRRADREPARAR